MAFIISMTPSNTMGTPTTAPMMVIVSTTPKIAITSPRIAPTSLPVTLRIQSTSWKSAQKGHSRKGILRFSSIFPLHLFWKKQFLYLIIGEWGLSKDRKYGDCHRHGQIFWSLRGIIARRSGSSACSGALSSRVKPDVTNDGTKTSLKIAFLSGWNAQPDLWPGRAGVIAAHDVWTLGLISFASNTSGNEPGSASEPGSFFQADCHSRYAPSQKNRKYRLQSPYYLSHD